MPNFLTAFIKSDFVLAAIISSNKNCGGFGMSLTPLSYLGLVPRYKVVDAKLGIKPLYEAGKNK